MDVKIISILLVTLTIITAGCIGNGTSNEKEDMKKAWDQYVENGFCEIDVSGENRVIQQSYQIYLDHNNITQMTLEYNFDDGDPGTNIDELMWISVTNVNYDEDDNEIIGKIEEKEGGIMPCNGEIYMNSSESHYLGPAFLVVIEVELSPSDDQWPGPLIWRGVADTGYVYDFVLNYEYVYRGNEENE